MFCSTIFAVSCSSLFQSKKSNTPPSFNVTDIESSREYTPHPDIEINKEDSLIVKEVIDTLPIIEQVDSTKVERDSTIVEKPQFIPFTAEQSSKMVITEYKDVEFDDITIDLRQGATHYPTEPHHVTSPYGWRRGRMHAGIDLKAYKGENIYAAFDGVVRLAKYYGAYGYCLILRHDNGLETLYGHSSKLLVGVNDHVKAGDVIALGGSTGRSTGAHCHFETRIKGIYFDPNLVIDTKTKTVKQANLHIAKRGNRLFASNNDNKEAREAYILEQITIKYYTVRSGDVLSRIAQRNHTTVSKLCRINGISSRSTLRIGQRLIVREGIKTPIKSDATKSATAPTTASSNNSAAKPAPAPAKKQNTEIYIYKVKSGDTLGAIAERNNTSISAICALNGITSRSTLQIGQRLQIPGSAPASSSAPTSSSYHTVRSGDVLSKIASRYDTSVKELCRINNISANSTLQIGQKIYLTSSAKSTPTSSSSATYHIVKSGDTLSGIAARYHTTVKELCRLNNITSRTTLQLKQKIKVK